MLSTHDERILHTHAIEIGELDDGAATMIDGLRAESAVRPSLPRASPRRSSHVIRDEPMMRQPLPF